MGEASEGNPRSLRALEWLNFFLADVQTGLGPFLAAYLASSGWNPGAVGYARRSAVWSPSRFRLPQELTELPGITDTAAKRIIRDRPYRDKQDLVNRGIVSRSSYEKIQEQITAK